MSLKENKTFLELVARYQAQPDKFIFFVGAGLSQPLFPSWTTMLNDLIEIADGHGLPYPKEELLGYVERGERFLDVAEACVGAMGDARYRSYLEEKFDLDFDESMVPPAYRELMARAPRTIVTTNYDRIPEIAGKGAYRIATSSNVAEAMRAIADGKKVAFKLHGDIADQASVVLTASDYQKIIFKSEGVRQLLNSLFTSKVAIFIGFSLSDPHIDDVLQYLNAICNGLPVSHYVLLNETSRFKLSSFESKYGVKAISYVPTNPTHPEVLEFIRALDPGKPSAKAVDEVPIARTEDELLSILESSLCEILVNSSYSVFLDDDVVSISYAVVGETQGEIQRELLSILGGINFRCPFLNRIDIYIYANTAPSLNVDTTQCLILVGECEFELVRKYVQKEISVSTFWKEIVFLSGFSLSDPRVANRAVPFSMNTGIVDN